MTNKEAIKSLQNIIEYWDMHSTEQEAAKLAIKALEQQEKEQWIPVGERLPDNEPSYISGTTYYVTLNTGVVRSAKYKEGKWIGKFGKLYANSEIIAWKKNVKPEPYKEGE